MSNEALQDLKENVTYRLKGFDDKPIQDPYLSGFKDGLNRAYKNMLAEIDKRLPPETEEKAVKFTGNPKTTVIISPDRERGSGYIGSFPELDPTFFFRIEDFYKVWERVTNMYDVALDRVYAQGRTPPDWLFDE